MPVSIGEWRVRIGRFVNSASEYYITERKEKLLKERIRRLKLLINRLLEKKEKLEDKVDLDENESRIINNDTPTDSHKEDTCSRSESTIEENTTQTESTTNHNSKGCDCTFPFFFTLLLSLFFLLFSLILFFVVDFFNLQGSFEPFLNWGGECTWRSTCFRIFVGSGLAKTVFSYVINTNEDVQDNLVLIGDENAKVKCIIKANKTSIESTNKANSTTTGTTIKSNNSPTESNIKENNTQTESVVGKNCTLTDSRNKETNITTESNKECNYIPTNATIKVSNTPSTNRDGPSEIIQSKTKTSKGKIIIEKNTTTELTIRENSTLPESTTKDDIAPKKCQIDTSSTITDKPSRTKTSKRKTLISKRKNNKEKKTATVLTYNSNNTMTESTIKGNDSPTNSNINKDNNTQIKSSIKENNSLTESVIKDNNTPNGSAIKDYNTKTESIFRNSNTLSTIKDKSSKRNIAKDKSIATESRIKENTTTTGSTIKGKSASTESAIKYNITSTESTTKDKNTPTKSTIKVNNASSESTIKKKNTPTESTIKVHNTTAERTINRNDTTTELTIKDRDSTTEPTIKDIKTQIEHTIKDYKTRIELSIKCNTSTIQCTINENNTPTEPPIKGNNSTSESTIRYSDTSNKSVLKESNTLSRTPIEDNNTQPMKAKTQAEYPIRSATQKVLSYGKHCISSQILSSLKGTTDDPVMQESTCLPEMILVKAGDVELNPGPCDRSENIQEQELFNLAYNVPSSKYTPLCIALGISYDQSQTILDRRNKDFTESLMQIFCQWKNRQSVGTDCRQAIAVALCGVNLDALGDKMSRGDYIPQKAAPTASMANEKDPLTTEQVTRCGDDKTQPLTKEQVERCGLDFKTFYRTQLCKIKTDPLDFSLVLEFERIYTDLVLLRNEQGMTKERIPLNYKELLETKVNGQLPKRLMVEGEAGAGKTTFCSKMAWDWTNGAKEFKEFVWVLVIPLRDIERNHTVGDIAKTYLSDSNSVHPHQIDEYILANPSKVFIIFDGLDEYDGDLVKQGNDIAKIIRSEKFRECKVLVTTRPWKADQIKSNKIFMRTYAFIAVAGFDKKHISIYINKYFSDDSQASRDLIKFIEDNDVIQENMAPFPIYIAMLCTLWKDSDSKKRELIQRLKTFSQLFQEIISFLKEHYVSKQFTDLDTEAVTQFYEQLSLFFEQIGKIALSGVVDKKLVYIKNDFSSCKEAMETCCRVGVLSKENRLVPRRDRRKNKTLPVTVNVFFPHKLFQEYLAGMYLASLFESDHEQYETAISDVIPRAKEFRYLLYFTASQSKNVAIDVTNRLINMRNYSTDRHFLADIAFEAYDEDSARVVGQHLFAEQNSLEIDDQMSAHTVSGYLFIMENITLETLILRRRSCGPTVSRDLADVICSSTALTALELCGTAFHDDFYGILESKVKTSKVERLSLISMKIPEEHASRNLARFLNNLPRLRDLKLQNNFVDGGFYKELASGACSAEVQKLSIGGCTLDINYPSASRDLARFICLQHCLIDLTIGLDDTVRGETHLHNEFYHELARLASSSKVQKLSIGVLTLKRNDLSASRDLARFLCLQPCLIDLTIGLNDKDLGPMLLHDKFYHELALLASCSKVQILSIGVLTLNINDPSASRDLARFLCLQPCLIDLTVGLNDMHSRPTFPHDKFYHELALLASSSKVQKLSIGVRTLAKNDPSASRDLARFLCLQPCLIDLMIGLNDMDYGPMFLHDEFYHELAILASSSKVQKLSIGMRTLDKNDPSASRDLARFLCLQPCLIDLTIWLNDTDFTPTLLHDKFYHELALLAFSSKVQKLSIGVRTLDKNDPSASRDLARFLCLQPCLIDLIIGLNNMNFGPTLLHDEFYRELALLASSSKVQKLSIGVLTLKRNDPSASRDLARFLCLQPCLIDLTIGLNDSDYRPTLLHDEFYHELALLASSSKVPKLSIGVRFLDRNDPSLSRDLARFLCLQPCLIDLTIGLIDTAYGPTCLHDEFYHELALLVSSSKVKKLSIKALFPERNDPSASRDLARFLCLQPCLIDLTIGHNDTTYGPMCLHDEFYHELALLASSSKVQKLSIGVYSLARNDPSASRNLARFLCLQPCLIDLMIGLNDMDYGPTLLHDEFYHELALLTSSSKIEKLCIDCNLEKNDPTVSRALAKFLCRLTFLTDLTMKDSGKLRVHDDFYHEISLLASFSKGRFFKENLHRNMWSTKLQKLQLQQKQQQQLCAIVHLETSGPRLSKSYD